MRVVTAPESLPEGGRRLFLAGGISNCPDWQEEALRHLDDLTNGSDVVVLNPRRAQPTMPVAQAPEQIRWEFRALANSDAVLFWFPAETLCPIALYELGRHAALGTGLAVGCDPNYQRLLDVREHWLWPDPRSGCAPG